MYSTINLSRGYVLDFPKMYAEPIQSRTIVYDLVPQMDSYDTAPFRLNKYDSTSRSWWDLRTDSNGIPLLDSQTAIRCSMAVTSNGYVTYSIRVNDTMFDGSPFDFTSLSIQLRVPVTNTGVDEWIRQESLLFSSASRSWQYTRTITTTMKANNVDLDWSLSIASDSYKVPYMDSQQTVDGALSLMTGAFNSMSGLLQTQLIGNLTIGGLVGIPLAVGLVACIFNIIRK